MVIELGNRCFVLNGRSYGIGNQMTGKLFDGRINFDATFCKDSGDNRNLSNT